jgi:hypothetical protein
MATWTPRSSSDPYQEDTNADDSGLPLGLVTNSGSSLGQSRSEADQESIRDLSRVPFLWISGGGFTATPILIHHQHQPRSHIACVHNRAYLIAGIYCVLLYFSECSQRMLMVDRLWRASSMDGVRFTGRASRGIPTVLSAIAIPSFSQPH